MNRLRQVRRTKGITLKELAEDTGIVENTLSQYETEKREPRRETWIKLADYYCVPVSYLMGLPDGLVQRINKTQAMTFEELHEAIIQWAENRNMISPKNTSRQYMKVSEELGEIAEGINKNNREQVEDSLGDILVTLIILAFSKDTPPNTSPAHTRLMSLTPRSDFLRSISASSPIRLGRHSLTRKHPAYHLPSMSDTSAFCPLASTIAASMSAASRGVAAPDTRVSR